MRLRRMVRIAALFGITFMFALTPLPAYGASNGGQGDLQACDDSMLRDLGVAILNCTGGSTVCTTARTSVPPTIKNTPGSIYVLGDSLTVGMRDFGSLRDRLSETGWTPTKINAVGGENLQWGISQVEIERDSIADSDAILIGLGTNNVGDVAKNDNSGLIEGGKETVKGLMQQLINAVKGVNPDIRIYWTTVYMTGTLSTRFGTFNMDASMPVINGALSEIAEANGFSQNLIHWGTSQEAKTLTSSDGLHPSGRYSEMAGYVVNGLNGVDSLSITANGCSCSLPGALSRDDRYRTVWDFLTNTNTGKGLSESAAAGLMGNLEAESGIDPHNMQDSAPLPDGPELPLDPSNSSLPHSSIRGKFGYGIAQWTSAVRQEKLIAFASSTNRSTGDLHTQLDFLWRELSENYTGVLAVLQDPEVTLASASYTVLAEFETPLPFTSNGTQEQRDAETANRLKKSQAIYEEFSGQAIAGFGNGGCNAFGTTIDMESLDTSHIPCGNGTEDLGPADGYNDGKPIKIRLCKVENAKINSQLAGSLKQLLIDMRAETGQNLTIGDHFRSMDQQIATYNKWCSIRGVIPTPPPYPKASYSDYNKCSGGAPPGWSNHQMGLAVDFVCNGGSLGQAYSEAKNNPCFQWLVKNSTRYGLYEFSKGEERDSIGYEGWHWSADGG